MLLRVLVVADQRPLAERLTRLVSTLDVLARTVTPSRGGDLDLSKRVLRDGYDLVLLGRNDFEGVELEVEELRARPRAPEVVVITRTRSVEGGAAALAAGSLGVLATDLQDDELRTALATLVERARTLREAITEIELSLEPSDELVVASPAMKQVVDTATRAARAASTVLILGETGVGKERIAQLVHQTSPRAHGPFIPLNCAAIPAELVESELFGHERGAFTGAHQARRGYFELAHGGTLFLDEIAELPTPAQAKLLRVLQDKQLRPVGSDRVIPVDVRLIAATNRDLEAAVEAGRFRSDLYYRLRVIELELPPLRERIEDVGHLLDTQLHRFNGILGRDIRGFTPSARAVLEAYEWPGNVRELINVVERAVLLCLGSEIGLEDLPRSITALRPASVVISPAAEDQGDISLPETWLGWTWREVREALLREGERAYLVHLLTASAGRVGVAARRAGLAERSLFEKMRRHGLRKEQFREDPELPPDKIGSQKSDRIS